MHPLPGWPLSHSRERCCRLVKQRSEAESWGVATAPPCSVLCSRAASFLMRCPLCMSLWVCFWGHTASAREASCGSMAEVPRAWKELVHSRVQAGITKLPPFLTVTTWGLVIHSTGFPGYRHGQQDTSKEEVESELPLLSSDLFH